MAVDRITGESSNDLEQVSSEPSEGAAAVCREPESPPTPTCRSALALKDELEEHPGDPREGWTRGLEWESRGGATLGRGEQGRYLDDVESASHKSVLASRPDLAHAGVSKRAAGDAARYSFGDARNGVELALGHGGFAVELGASVKADGEREAGASVSGEVAAIRYQASLHRTIGGRDIEAEGTVDIGKVSGRAGLHQAWGPEGVEGELDLKAKADLISMKGQVGTRLVIGGEDVGSIGVQGEAGLGVGMAEELRWGARDGRVQFSERTGIGAGLGGAVGLSFDVDPRAATRGVLKAGIDDAAEIWGGAVENLHQAVATGAEREARDLSAVSAEAERRGERIKAAILGAGAAVVGAGAGVMKAAVRVDEIERRWTKDLGQRIDDLPVIGKK